MTNMTETEKAKEVAFIENEDIWPHWPLLPMKKIGTNLRVGVLLGRDMNAQKGTTFRFFPDTSIFDIKHVNVEQYQPKTAKELVEEGWIGD